VAWKVTNVEWLRHAEPPNPDFASEGNFYVGLKAPSTVAQGNALGEVIQINCRPEGACQNSHLFCFVPSGECSLNPTTQGAARAIMSVRFQRDLSTRKKAALASHA
jgi:hypothetical protein